MMVDESTPAITLGTRGLVAADIEVRTARRDLHSGMYGGAVLNAAHVLMAMLAEVAPDAEGRVRPELAAGVAPVRGGGARVLGAAAAGRRGRSPRSAGRR